MIAWVGLTVCILFGSVAWAADVAREDLGRTEKLRIVVDKVMQPQEKWVTKEWMIKEAAEAGFNVFSPRRGHDQLDEVVEVTEWCEKYGIYHMPWMRGTLVAPKDESADGKRVVWANGGEQALWSVNSDEFWAWTTKYIVEYAKISAANEHLMGVFLDYENYAAGKQGNLYSLSYDKAIMDKFAEAEGVELPDLALNERASWLKEQGFEEQFAEFQVNHWRERCRTLREAVDEYDPAFQFCIYPAPGTPFMVKACYPEWSTEKAPIILADPWTYGRSSRFLPQKEALEANRAKLLRGMEVPKAAGIPYIYAGGIDPVVRGADPEFCGKNAVMISDVTDGYWIFYEGPKYDEDHPDYFRWFAWANKAIHSGGLKAWQEPRETEEDWSLAIFDNTEGTPKLALPPVTGETVKFPPMQLRRDNMFALAVKAGEPVEIVLQNRRVGRYESLLVWELRRANLEKLATGQIPHAQAGTVTFTPEEDGVYFLGASAGSCAYSLVSANVPVGLFTGNTASFIFGAKRLYFAVPEGVKEFSVTVAGSGVETVRVNVYSPTEELVATGQTRPNQGTVTVKVAVGEHAGATWTLETTRADEGVLEDNTLALSAELPPILSLVPDHVFGKAQE